MDTMAATLGTSPMPSLANLGAAGFPHSSRCTVILVQAAVQLSKALALGGSCFLHVFSTLCFNADTQVVPYLFRSYVLATFSSRITLLRHHLLHLSRPTHPALTKETPAFPTVFRGRRVHLVSTSHEVVKAAFSISIQWPDGSAD